MTEVQSDITLKDRIRSVLLSFGEKEFSITNDDLIGKLGNGATGSSVYQALYAMNRDNEIEILKERDSLGRNRMVGVRLMKMEGAENINQRVLESTVKARTNTHVFRFKDKIPQTVKYLQQRAGVEEARAVLVKYGIENSAQIVFEANPYGEEALLMLQRIENQEASIQEYRQLLQEANTKLQMIEARTGAPVAKESNEVPNPVNAD